MAQRRWVPVAGSVLYAGLGVMAAEFLLLGIAQIGHFPANRIVLELSMFFAGAAVFLDPLGALFGTKLDGTPARTGRPRLSSGVIGIGVALIFVGFNLTVDGAFHPQGSGTLFYLFGHVVLLLYIPFVVTFGWIAGSRRRYGAAIYGALAGFVTDGVVRLILWFITGFMGDPPEPVTLTTAIVAILAGAIKAAFYSACGGLALDLTLGRGVSAPIGAEQAVRNLTLALLGALGIWTLGYYLIGGAIGLPNADALSQLKVFYEQLLVYGGWMVGLAIYPEFVASIQPANIVKTSRAESRFLELVIFAPAFIALDFLTFIAVFRVATPELLPGLILAAVSCVAWQFSLVTTNVISKLLNALAALCAFGSAALLLPQLSALLASKR